MFTRGIGDGFMGITSDLMYRLLVQSVSDYAIFMVARDGTVLNWNAGAERAKGFTAAEIVGRNYEIFYSAEERAAGVPRGNLERAEREGRIVLEGWRYRRDGTAFWASITIDAIYDADGSFLGFAKVTRDLTEQHELMALIEHEANHDGLTGLLNRSGLFKRIAAELAEGRPLVMYCIDLDRFKPINDRLGHAAGDSVLHAVAGRLSALVGDAGIVGRIGGDEFVLIRLRSLDAHDPLVFGRSISSSVGAPIAIGEETVAVGASIGVVRAPEHGSETAALLRLADAALYEAKATGRDRVVLHSGAVT